MKGSNSLTSHCPERTNRRVDKMGKYEWEALRGKSKKFWKRFAAKKMRQLLKTNKEDKI